MKRQANRSLHTNANIAPMFQCERPRLAVGEVLTLGAKRIRIFK